MPYLYKEQAIQQHPYNKCTMRVCMFTHSIHHAAIVNDAAITLCASILLRDSKEKAINVVSFTALNSGRWQTEGLLGATGILLFYLGSLVDPILSYGAMEL